MPKPKADESCPSKTFPIYRRQSPRQMKKIIEQHLANNIGRTKSLAYKDTVILSILDTVKGVLMKQPSLVQVKAPIKIVGDIHGQFNDLKRILKANGYPPDTKYIFLGDYVDRGMHSLETIMLLLTYKSLYPDNIYLIRGNHEAMNINRVYGFFDELQRRSCLHLYPEFNQVFNYLPLAGLIDKKILCMHGGISKHLNSLEDIQQLERPLSMIPPDIEDAPLMALDLLWADPEKDRNGWLPSRRGISHSFGMDVLDQFCRRLKLELIVRAHQVVPRGFERMGPSPDRTRLVTVFSAPNYCNEFDNDGAIMSVSIKHSIQFTVLEASRIDQDDTQRETERSNTPSYDVFPDLDVTQRELSMPKSMKPL